MFAAVLVIKAFRQMYTAKTGYIRGDASCIPVDSKPARRFVDSIASPTIL